MIGKRIKELRKRKNMTLKTLAERVPLSVSFLCDIENGRTNPTVNRLIEIAVALDTTPAYLIEGGKISADNFSEATRGDVMFEEVIGFLSDFETWPLDDRDELLKYMRAKSLIRYGGKN